jgi:hypothetical protein
MLKESRLETDKLGFIMKEAISMQFKKSVVEEH